MFGFNSTIYDLNLIESYLLRILVNDQDIEPTVIKKANQFISFNFGDIRLLDKLNFLDGAISLDSFLKEYKIKKQKDVSPTNGLITLRKWRIQTFPQMTTFTIGFVAAAFLKPNTRTILTY